MVSEDTSELDCLIARIAMEHDLLLLHNDRDFEAMATIIPLEAVLKIFAAVMQRQ